MSIPLAERVAPGEVVGLCDVDSKAVATASELLATRQSSKKKPPVFGDYRKLLAETRPEIVLMGTPDHWHCLPMIDASKAGADVYVQRPISYDVVEGQAMVAAARKYKRTVQVGLERGSTRISWKRAIVTSRAACLAKSHTWTFTPVRSRPGLWSAEDLSGLRQV